jgi:hypothetical protein
MASRARARTPVKAPEPTVVTITLGDETHVCDIRTATFLERWKAKDALKARGLPTDDDELMMAAVIWVIAQRTAPDLSIDDVLDAAPADVGLGAADVDDPEA